MNKDLLTYAREIACNNPPCLISPLEFRRVIGELADRLEQAESALRRIHAVCVDDTRSAHWRVGYAEGTAELAAVKEDAELALAELEGVDTDDKNNCLKAAVSVLQRMAAIAAERAARKETE